VRRTRRTLDRSQLTPLFAPNDTASFFLPGIVHQFGNLLLTVQGQALHVEPDGVARMQKAILNAVQRGSSSLQVVRAMLGEQTGATGSAHDLITQLAELGRVPARECGLSLELRGKEPATIAWVASESFVMTIAEALRRWIGAVRTGSNGAVTVEMQVADGGQVVVLLGYEPGEGSLPFPMPCDSVAAALSAHAHAAGGTATAMDASKSGATYGIEIRFGTDAIAPGCQA